MFIAQALRPTSGFFTILRASQKAQSREKQIARGFLSLCAFAVLESRWDAEAAIPKRADGGVYFQGMCVAGHTAGLLRPTPLALVIRGSAPVLPSGGLGWSTGSPCTVEVEALGTRARGFGVPSVQCAGKESGAPEHAC